MNKNTNIINKAMEMLDKKFPGLTRSESVERLLGEKETYVEDKTAATLRLPIYPELMTTQLIGANHTVSTAVRINRKGKWWLVPLVLHWRNARHGLTNLNLFSVHVHNIMHFYEIPDKLNMRKTLGLVEDPDQRTEKERLLEKVKLRMEKSFKK